MVEMENNNTVDVKAMKLEAERKIKEILADFEDQTGLKVDWFSVKRPNSDNWDLPYDQMMDGPITEVTFSAELREIKKLAQKKEEHMFRKGQEEKLQGADGHKFS
jgi:hypothetical protein